MNTFAYLIRNEDPSLYTPIPLCILTSSAAWSADYRVVFDIEGEDIIVLRAGHRWDIYKRG
jgi:hypothetical protein